MKTKIYRVLILEQHSRTGAHGKKKTGHEDTIWADVMLHTKIIAHN